MDLGVFSMSLDVADIKKSVAFYEMLGFKVIDGGHMNEDMPDSAEGKWRILEHDSVKIGLFQDMFDENIMTFMPPDVRKIQRRLQANGVDLIAEADEDEDGPAAIVLADPDGNLLMFDQL
jgi:catechol 2,3-dioxygenase-like lactoylglutathione lyase family enzyme